MSADPKTVETWGGHKKGHSPEWEKKGKRAEQVPMKGQFFTHKNDKSEIE